jgi:hypothetical protein
MSTPCPFPCPSLFASELSPLGHDAAPMATHGFFVAPSPSLTHVARRAALADTSSAHAQASHGLARTLCPTLPYRRLHDPSPRSAPSGSAVEWLVLGTCTHQAKAPPCLATTVPGHTPRAIDMRSAHPPSLLHWLCCSEPRPCTHANTEALSRKGPTFLHT